ncbi:hypothetical protein ACFX13_025729 [Malus domestica]
MDGHDQAVQEKKVGLQAKDTLQSNMGGHRMSEEIKKSKRNKQKEKQSSKLRHKSKRERHSGKQKRKQSRKNIEKKQ